jgi:hypothetical protein
MICIGDFGCDGCVGLMIWITGARAHRGFFLVNEVLQALLDDLFDGECFEESMKLR